MELFPNVLVRVSGGPFKKVEALHLQQAARIAQDIYKLQATIKTLKQALSDALYEVVGTQPDSATRVSLINLRRDIFNEREIPAELLALPGPYLSQAIYESVSYYVSLKKNLDHLWQEGETVYERECKIARHYLRCLGEEENLQKGLILSSQSLLKYGIPNYLNDDSRPLTKQERKTEQSLIKYISRIYAKTSPFSTFTNLAMGKIRWNEETAGDHFQSLLSMEGDSETAVLSHIRLNNYLYKYLKDLLTHDAKIYRHFLLRPNPTLTREDNRYLYLTNSNNVESFQRIPLNPVLELLEALTSSQREGVPYQAVVQSIIENEYIDATAEEIEAYINQLIAYGFLEFNVGVSGIDPDWDVKVRRKLKPLRDEIPLINELLETLAHIRKLASQYEKAGVTARQQILHEAYEQFKAICMKLHEAAGLPQEERLPLEEQKTNLIGPEEEPDADEESQGEVSDGQEAAFQHHMATRFYFRPEQMFYEDTSLGASFTINGEEVSQVMAPLQRLFSEITLFEGLADEQARMRHYFEQKYGHNAPVDLLTFYEGYYREIKKPEGESGNAPLSVPASEKRRERAQAWQKQLAAIIGEEALLKNGPIHIRYEQVVESNKQLCVGNRGQVATSHGVFVQLFKDDEGEQSHLMAVINSCFPGYGKMMSRFLHLFEEEITCELRHCNQSLSQDKLLIEDCDASYFNANLHPPLMPFEIWMPGGHNSLPAQQQIAVTELQVCPDEAGEQLQLIHKPSQKRCYVFDLGFQGHGGRSQLFKLLRNFTGAEHLSGSPLLTAVALSRQSLDTAKGEANQRIQIRPRVVYDERIVLQRKAWFIPRSLLPLRRPEDSDWAYFARLNQWRLQQEIPEEVFVYLFKRDALQNLEPEAQQKLSRDDYKPQYICFKNPFLVGLFEKLLNKVPNNLIIEEMLPDSEQLLQIGQEGHVTEFVIQWYEWERKAT